MKLTTPYMNRTGSESRLSHAVGQYSEQSDTASIARRSRQSDMHSEESELDTSGQNEIRRADLDSLPGIDLVSVEEPG